VPAGPNTATDPIDVNSDCADDVVGFASYSLMEMGVVEARAFAGILTPSPVVNVTVPASFAEIVSTAEPNSTASVPQSWSKNPGSHWHKLPTTMPRQVSEQSAPNLSASVHVGAV